ncbi:hypothetical protein PsorP6_012203 [Peronosclerospora sorghi]|uniref:Uncharacterized protein n=1 Tax=Peronosclerospora sorghi TaxID=230839 RepID=A0ACC0WM95_9STRA|nr:hypothetical protein PsorP6_012203 [Peronosclerospora sorghi]
MGLHLFTLLVVLNRSLAMLPGGLRGLMRLRTIGKQLPECRYQTASFLANRKFHIRQLRVLVVIFFIDITVMDRLSDYLFIYLQDLLIHVAVGDTECLACLVRLVLVAGPGISGAQGNQFVGSDSRRSGRLFVGCPNDQRCLKKWSQPPSFQQICRVLQRVQ